MLVLSRAKIYQPQELQNETSYFDSHTSKIIKKTPEREED